MAANLLRRLLFPRAVFWLPAECQHTTPGTASNSCTIKGEKQLGVLLNASFLQTGSYHSMPWAQRPLASPQVHTLPLGAL